MQHQRESLPLKMRETVCTALVEASHAKGYDRMLPCLEHTWLQMQQQANYLSSVVTSTTRKAVALACLLLSILLT